MTKKERKRLKKLEKKRQKEEIRRRQRVQKRLLLAVGLLVLGGGLWGIFQASQRVADQPVVSSDQISETDWTKGKPEAPVSLVEYSDFQCPACGFYHSLVSQLTEEYGEQILFVYRHFPLDRIHQNARLAAQAAEAAGQQGMFWEMHDLLFAKQNEWSEQSSAEESFIGYAESFGLDLDQFKNDLQSEKVKDKVENDYFSGLQAQVNATPTFFLNGDKVNNPRSLEEFKEVIDKAIQSAGS